MTLPTSTWGCDTQVTLPPGKQPSKRWQKPPISLISRSDCVTDMILGTPHSKEPRASTPPTAKHEESCALRKVQEGSPTSRNESFGEGLIPW